MNDIKKTSEDWSKLLAKGVYVHDPDGWDRHSFEYSWFKEPITKQEFEGRFIQSTVTMPPTAGSMWADDAVNDLVGVDFGYGKSYLESAQNAQPDTDTRIDQLLALIYTKPKVNGRDIEGESVNKTFVKQTIKDLIAEQVAAARIDELKKYYFDHPSHKNAKGTTDRIAELKKGQK